MRIRLLGLIPAAALVLPLGMASAASAGNSTQLPLQNPMDLGQATCLPGSPELFVSIASGHDHAVQNANGDWENSTVQGTFYTSDGVWSGHGETWFGFEGNKHTLVAHLTGNAQVSDAAGDKVALHTEAQLVVNANGVLTVYRNGGAIIAPPVISCH
jgi:hypothetical protein